MLNQEGLSVLQSIVISGAGMFVVVCELAILSISIRLFTWFLSFFSQHEVNHNETYQESLNIAGSHAAIKEQEQVVVLAVMSDYLNETGGQYQITSIKEVDG